MPLTIETRPNARGANVTISGIIDENANFDQLTALRGRLEICMKDVRRINSFGARSWMDVIRALGKEAQLVFVECSPPIIDQLNMINGFLGHGAVESFYGPMICERCEDEHLHLFTSREVNDNEGYLTKVNCDHCNIPMELDDLEDQYTLFLREPTRVGG